MNLFYLKMQWNGNTAQSCKALAFHGYICKLETVKYRAHPGNAHTEMDNHLRQRFCFNNFLLWKTNGPKVATIASPSSCFHYYWLTFQSFFVLSAIYNALQLQYRWSRNCLLLRFIISSSLNYVIRRFD